MLTKAFGETLRRLRRESGKNRAQLARESGINYRHVQDLEAGKAHPSMKTLLLLAAALGVTPDKILNPVWDAWNKAGQPDD